MKFVRLLRGAGLSTLVLALVMTSTGAWGSELPPEMSSRIEKAVARYAPGIDVGVCVRRLPDGAVLFARRSDRRYILASNTKLMTTAAALDVLGREGFFTRLYATGAVDYFGNLDGSLVISGTGDTSLPAELAADDIARLVDTWIAGIKGSGIRSVMGNIVVDHAFDPATDNALGGDFVSEDGDAAADGDSDGDDEDAAAEAEETEALLLLVMPGAEAGKPASLAVRPSGSSIRVINSCFTVPGPTREVKVSRTKSGALLVSGKIGMAADSVTHILAYGDPGLRAASLLRESLPGRGVPIRGDVRLGAEDVGSGARLLSETRAELAATLHLVNKHSNNQAAEALLRVIGSRSPDARRIGQAAAGKRLVGGYLTTSGIPSTAFQVGDGSGLSRENQMTPAALTQLLVTMASGPSAAVFKDSLAVPRGEGTLERRLPGIERYARVAAKTGHIRGVNTLSGYLDTAKGSYAFSVLTNGTKGRAGNELLDIVTTQIASALAVADGSITQADAAPEPSYKPRPKARSRRRSTRRRR